MKITDVKIRFICNHLKNKECSKKNCRYLRKSKKYCKATTKIEYAKNITKKEYEELLTTPFDSYEENDIIHIGKKKFIINNKVVSSSNNKEISSIYISEYGID